MPPDNNDKWRDGDVMEEATPLIAPSTSTAATPSHHPLSRYHFVCLLGYSLSFIIFGSQVSILGPTIKPLSAKLGVDETDLSPLFTALGVSCIISGTPSGWVVDRFPTHHVLIASLLIEVSMAEHLLNRRGQSLREHEAERHARVLFCKRHGTTAELDAYIGRCMGAWTYAFSLPPILHAAIVGSTPHLNFSPNRHFTPPMRANLTIALAIGFSPVL